MPGLLLGVLLLYLCFRNLDWRQFGTHLGRIPLLGHALMMVPILTGLFFRGWRWWYTLPDPGRQEFWPAQRALACAYALNNLGPRFGEVARVVLLARRTARPPAQILSSVVLDRLVLDTAVLLAVLAAALLGARGPLEKVVPGASGALPPLLGLLLFALGSLLFCLFQPERCLALIGLLGLDRFPRLAEVLRRWFGQLVSGLAILGAPRRYPLLILLTLAIWASYVLGFLLGLRLCAIWGDLAGLMLCYTMTLLGMVVPSPGGVGSVHALGSLGLVVLLGVEREAALAAITYIHGANFIAMLVLGLFAFMVEQRLLPRGGG
jgi:uncharacterized membrane protein YbhN (UPF0104 family)